MNTIEIQRKRVLKRVLDCENEETLNTIDSILSSSEATISENRNSLVASIQKAEEQSALGKRTELRKIPRK